MPLYFQPKPGMLVKCNFDGLMVPEMVKVRPALIIHSHRTNLKLVTVVPLSATEPVIIEYYHHEFIPSGEVTYYFKSMRRWYKCDLVYVVSIDRMEQLRHAVTGKRYCPSVSHQELEVVKKMVRLANGL